MNVIGLKTGFFNTSYNEVNTLSTVSSTKQVNEQEQQGEKNFEYLIEYLSQEEKEELISVLKQVPDNEEFFNQFAEQLIQGKWEDLFSENPENFPLNTLYCLRKGLIEDSTFATSLTFFNVYNHPENQTEKARFVRVFKPNGQKDPNSQNMIAATMKVANSTFVKISNIILEFPINCFIKKFEISIIKKIIEDKDKFRSELQKASKTYFWTKEQEQQFYQNLKKLSPCEQSFMLVNDDYFDQFLDQPSVVDIIDLWFGSGFFSRLSVGGKSLRMIPSKGLMQTYLETIHPTSTPKPRFRLGLSTNNGLHETLKMGYRDVIQSASFTEAIKNKTPKIVDMTRANSRYAEAEAHDYSYHLSLISNIPIDHRTLFNDLADHILKFSKTNEHNVFVEKLFSRIIDMEFRLYCPRRLISCFRKIFIKTVSLNEEPSNLSQLDIESPFVFWITIEDILKTLEDNIRAEKLGSDYEKQINESKKELYLCIAEWIMNDKWNNEKNIQDILTYLFSQNLRKHTPCLAHIFSITEMIAFEKIKDKDQRFFDRLSKGKTLNFINLILVYSQREFLKKQKNH